MKKVALLFVIILVLTTIILGSCSSTPSTTTSTMTTTATTTSSVTSTTTATTTTTSIIKPVIIRLAPVTAGPPPSLGLTVTASEMARILEEKTGGRVKFEIYWSETLAKGTELVNAVQTNIANMAMLRTFAEPGKIPLSTVGELPGIWPDQWVGTRAYTDLMQQDPLKSELAKYSIKGYAACTILDQQLIANKAIRSLADLQGKKVAAAGVAGTIYKLLGAVPLAMSPTEQYEGLSRGTIDAISAPQDAIQAFKFYEAGKYFATIKTVPRVHPIVFNQGFWDSLTPDIQKMLNDAVPDILKSSYEAINVTTAGVAWKNITDPAQKVEVIEWSAADTAAVNKILSAYADTWAKDTDAKGLPGTQVLNDYRTLSAKYAPLSPYKK
jgi:TRAP-type C4-dicarboxylate transport system substrate-binding protein